jgi:GTPase
MAQNKTFCGRIAIIGRPNVGKSTLLNMILDQRLSIVTPKAQTTRHQILGIQTIDQHQLLFLDTPGIHSKQPRALNRMMNRVASTSMREADLIVFMVTATSWSQDDQWALESIKTSERPTLLCINKVDTLSSETELLEGVAQLRHKHTFSEVTSISAKTGDGVGALLAWCQTHLPEGSHLFPANQTISDRGEAFFIAETIREQLMFSCQQELPYAIHVQVDNLVKEKTIWRANVVIWVENDGQKKIVVGSKGQMLKDVGTRARKRLEKRYKTKFYLKLWVKVKKGWVDELPDELHDSFF